MRQVPRAATVLVAVTGLLLTITVGWLLVSQARTEHDDRVVQAAEVLQASATSDLRALEASLEAIRNGLTPGQGPVLDWDVDREHVDAALLRGFEQRSIDGANAVGLFRRVPSDQIDIYERAVSAQTGRDVQVYPERAEGEAFVVELVRPLAGNDSALGWDLASEPRRLRAVQRARDTGQAATTEPINLVQNGNAAVLIIVPAYSTYGVPETAPGRREAFVGGISAVIDPAVLLESTVAQDLRLDIAIVDVGAIGLAGTQQSLQEGAVVLGTVPAQPGAQLDLHVGDRRWRLAVTPTDGFGGANYWPALLWTVAMLLLTGIGAALVEVLRTRELRANELVDQKTRELVASEEQLRNMNATLSESDALKTSFLVTVSHELRTPLTTIRGFAELLQRPDADLDMRERAWFLQQMSRSAEGLSDLLAEVLEFAELEQLGPRISSTSFELSALIRDVADPYGETNELALQVREGSAVGDPQHLRRALSCVLNNARAYSPAGSTIGVWMRPVDDQWQIVVDDEGPGIPVAARETVFQRFYRGDLASAGNVPGTGIGLTVARQLLDAMGGGVAIESTPGGGTRVVINLLASHGTVPHADELSEVHT